MKPFWSFCLGVVSAAWLAWSATAQPVTDPTAPPTPAAPADTAAAPKTFTFTASYTADTLANLHGGERTGVRYVDLLKLSAAYDGAAAGHDGLTGLISVQHHNGSRFSGELVGDVQVVTNSDAPPEALRLYEAWLQKELLGGKGGVKGGLIDLNTTFDVQETAALFMNSSHGIGADFSDTGLNGPSIDPTTALAITGVYRPSEDWTVQLGVFDGVAGDPPQRRQFVAIKLSARDGALIVGQVEKRFGDTARVEGGAWSYTSAFDALDQSGVVGSPRRLHGDAGVYGLVEGKLLAKPKADEGGLSGWLRLGVANGDINPVDNYVGAGLVYTGLIAGRDKDEVGVAIARAGFGGGAHAAARAAGITLVDNETTLEATYRYVFKDWLNIQPDVQYVIHPGGNALLGNALVVGLRMAFTVSR